MRQRKIGNHWRHWRGASTQPVVDLGGDIRRQSHPSALHELINVILNPLRHFTGLPVEKLRKLPIIPCGIRHDLPQ